MLLIFSVVGDLLNKARGLFMATTAADIQRRYLTLDDSTADSDQLTFSFSSETPVTRYFGDEVLDHDPASVDLSRLNGGAAPLLLNHDPDQVLGLVERAWIDPDKRRGMARIRWASNDRAQQVRADVEARVMPNISVGYAVIDATSEGEVMHVKRWQPVELSIVSIPADPTIGVNRAIPSTSSSTRAMTTAPAVDYFGRPIQTAVPARDEFQQESREFSFVRAIQASASGN